MSDSGGARAATPELVRQLVREVRDQVAGRPHPRPLVIGARARPAWAHGPLSDPAAGPIQVAACPTPLAARRALADHRSDGDDSTLVVLTDLAEADLGADVVGRFVQPRLIALSPWNAVCQRLGVHQIDPDFDKEKHAWMAAALLDLPAEQLPCSSGVLTVDTALAAISQAVLGAEAPTVERLLVASADPTFASRVDQVDARLLERLCANLGEHLGPAGLLVTGTIARGHGERALPAGLVARTLVEAGTATYAQAKVADLTGVEQPTDPALDAWARAAELAFAALEAQENPVAVNVAVAGASLARDWQAPFPAASDVLSSSFDARLDLLSHQIETLLDATADADTTELRDAVRAVTSHHEAHHDLGRARAERARLAARLVAWLRDPISQRHGTGFTAADASGLPASLIDVIDAYGSDGAWVDAARRRVGEGDDSPAAFADALRRVSEAAHLRRAEGNRFFAQTLARWSTDGTSAELAGSPVVAVEVLLSEMIVPLAKIQPTLLVVLDGCGLTQFVEFADQFRRFGLDEIGRDGQRSVALAALPTVTSVSRTSLLTGQLRTGAAADEGRLLPANPAVARLPGSPAEVFHHHSDLVTGVGQGLPTNVLRALQADGPRLVAAVVNTIDDELSRGTFTPEYRIEHLGPLPSLLRAAVDAGRAVVITADHGHVLGIGLDGKGDARRDGYGGERWRVADRAPTDDEVLLHGPRVMLGGEHGVLAPWHDDLRYSAKHGGYHGGATPDECVVPLAVFNPIGQEPPRGWEPVAVPTPPWWDLHVTMSAEESEPAPAPRKRGKDRRTEGQFELFGDGATPDEQPIPNRDDSPAAATVGWLDALIGSDLYAVQLGVIGRSKLSEERVRATLVVLHARGGVASFAVIAQATGMPLVRVSGFLATLARLLNADGFGVLVVDATAREARLNEALLQRQFLEDGS